MWLSIVKNKPPEKVRVKIKHMITGTGAPEREGWESTGFYYNGRWTIKYVKGVDLNKKPTHWDYLG